MADCICKYGNKLSSTANFCGQCGNPKPMCTNDTRLCSCGKKYLLSSNNNFCIDCGSKLDNEASLDTPIMHDNISRSTAATAEIQGENQKVSGKKFKHLFYHSAVFNKKFKGWPAFRCMEIPKYTKTGWVL